MIIFENVTIEGEGIIISIEPSGNGIVFQNLNETTEVFPMKVIIQPTLSSSDVTTSLTESLMIGPDNYYQPLVSFNREKSLTESLKLEYNTNTQIIMNNNQNFVPITLVAGV